MNWLKVFLLFSFLGIVNTGCSQRPDHKSKEILELQELNSKKEHRRVIKMSKELLKNNPNDLQILRQLGIAYYDMSISDSSYVNFRDNAKSIFSKMNSIDSSNIFALKSLGVVFYDEQDCDSSYYYFSKALLFKTLDGETYFDDAPQLNDFDIASEYLMYLRARTCIYLKCNLKGAIKDVQFCINSGYMLKETYLLGGILSYAFDLKEQCCNHLNEAKKLGNEEADFYLEQFCLSP